MHLIEKYALSCGLKIGQPYIYDKYFPTTVGQYITIHTTSKEAKTYDLWQEVVDILLPILEKQKISIVQIGGKDDRPLSFIYSILGQTNINQTAYLIKHCLLHVGVDSFPVHVAGYYNKPLVAIYSNNYIDCVKPYWGFPERQILIEPERKDGAKPSFSLSESPKTINLIKPEKIAAGVCKLLDIPFGYNYETVFIGDAFSAIILESVPNQVVDGKQFGVDSLIMRMDFEFNEENLATQLNLIKCSIVTDKPINGNLLKTFKPNIVEIHYEITENSSLEFVKFLRHVGIKVNLYSFIENDKLAKYKLQFMEYGVIHPQTKEIPSQIKELNPFDLFFKSAKFTLSKGKIYPSRYSMLNNQPVDTIGNHLISLEKADITKLETLFSEARHLRFVKKYEEKKA